jgi:hypothetical protein
MTVVNAVEVVAVSAVVVTVMAAVEIARVDTVVVRTVARAAKRVVLLVNSRLLSVAGLVAVVVPLLLRKRLAQRLASVFGR